MQGRIRAERGSAAAPDPLAAAALIRSLIKKIRKATATK